MDNDIVIYKINNIKSNLEFGKSIKSKYILEEIFSFLERKRIFKIIIYNKYLQHTYKINIKDYKKMSGKYKVGKKNGRGREFELYTNNLIFEGKYFKGKRDGKGKEYYDNGQLKFKGEYLKGKRDGKGKEYYDNSQLKFEG